MGKFPPIFAHQRVAIQQRSALDNFLDTNNNAPTFVATTGSNDLLAAEQVAALEKSLEARVIGTGMRRSTGARSGRYVLDQVNHEKQRLLCDGADEARYFHRTCSNEAHVSFHRVQHSAVCYCVLVQKLARRIAQWILSSNLPIEYALKKLQLP